MRPEKIDSSSFTSDILEFIKLLHLHRVKYLVVGGEAVIFYGHVRLTGDVDFFYDRREDNVQRLHAALDEFWQGNIPGVSDFVTLTEEGNIVQFGLPPNRIDLLNTVDGVEFDMAWPARTIVDVVSESGTFPLLYIGLDDLIANKAAAGRPKDLDDLRFLRRVKR